jgi:hypothetical protein
MIVCDAVHRDQATGKFFLLGTFSTIFTRSVPCVHPHMCLFFAVTECRGTTPFTVTLVRVDPELGQDQKVAELQGEIRSEDPLRVHELIMRLKDVRFEQAGEYRFQLQSAGELLLEKRLIVALRGGGGPAPG